jgi:hypothetical protein
MKSSIKILFFVFAVSLFVTSCNTGKNLYVKGNYYEAVIRSVEKLRKSPNNKNARETLANAYPNAVDTFLDQLENNKNSEFRNTNAVYTYQKLNGMYETIQRSPAAKNVIDYPKKYYSQLDKVKPKAAQEQYAAGLSHLNYGDRENTKQAYFYFLEAEKFVPNYKDVANKIDEAYNLSILNVLANLKPVQSRIYDLSADIFYTEVKNIFNQIEQKEFIRFYTLEQAKSMNIENPDHYLEINFEDFVVGETHIRERVEKMERDSLKVGQITLDDGTKKDVFGTVKATVSISKMEVISKGLINLSITKNGMDNKDLIYQDFAGEYVWFNEWGNYNGDKRALTDNQIEICRQKRMNPLPPQQMFVEFTKPIHDQLRRRLFTFYNNY